MDETTPNSGTWPMRRVALWIVAVGSVLSSPLAFVVGALLGEQGAYARRFEEERAALAPAVANDPAFAGVEIDRYSAGGADLYGTVETEEDLIRLRAAFVNAIGEARAREHFRVEVVTADHATTDGNP